MQDLISRQAAIDRFNVIRPVDPKKDEYTKGIDVGIAMCIVAIKDQPTAQPEPKEGHWINGKCDLCGEHAPFWCMASTYHESNYCPNCGSYNGGGRK